MGKNIKTILFSAVLLGLVLFLVEIFSAGALFFLENFKDIKYRSISYDLESHQRKIIKELLINRSGYKVFDKNLGWKVKESLNTGHIISNSQGIRSDKEYSFIPKEGTVRIATFGDSFTFCSVVTNEHTWQKFLEDKDSRLEVLNFGVGAFGLDQAYLRYLQQGAKYHPKIVFIGYMPDNYFRHVYTFRFFYSRGTYIPFVKPRFEVVNDQLKLIENKFQRVEEYQSLLDGNYDVYDYLCQYDYYCQTRPHKSPADIFHSVKLFKALNHLYLPGKEPLIIDNIYNPKSEAFIVTRKIFDQFYQEVLKDGAVPIIIIFPNETDFDVVYKKGKKRYADLLKVWDEKEYNYFDLTDDFMTVADKNTLKSLFTPDHHYNAKGNYYATQFIYKHLVEKSFISALGVNNMGQE